MLVALKDVRRNAVLDLWFAGKTQGEIIEELPIETECSVQYYIRKARQAGDARATPRCTVNRYLDLAEKHREDVLALIELGEPQYKVAKAIGIEPGCVRSIVERARRAGDPRAERRSKADREPPPVSLHPTDTETLEVYSTDAALFGMPRPVSVKRIAFGEHQSLRPIAYSIDRAAQARETSVTARLMGDPAPGRSVLGRECRPDEYASGTGEGRFTTKFHSPGASRVGAGGRVEQ